MQLAGMILIASWALIGILLPVLAYIFDKMRGIDDKDAMISTGRYDSHISAIQITILLSAAIRSGYYSKCYWANKVE